VAFDVVTREDLVRRVHEFVDCGASHVVRFVPTHPVVLAKRDDEYRRMLNGSSLVLADGVGPVLGARLNGATLTRISGTEGMRAILAEEGLRHYLFGGSPAVADALRARVAALYGEEAVVGVESPPFRTLSDEEWEGAARRMRAAGAEIVWVGLGTPKQDYAAAKLQALSAAPVIASVGAAFDFYAGSKRRAPWIMRTLGLEWLFRLIQEPRRLWRRYMVGNALFVYDLVVSALPRRAAGSAPAKR
jgi:N-acetylglucosaminyldiphosphoundecaprenol N-acetyl-beta-D-mannosaminyltransferase